MKSTLEKKKTENVVEKTQETNVIKNRSLHNVYQTEEATYVELALPGYTKKDIEIKIEKDAMRVSSLPEQVEATDKKIHFVSRGFKRVPFSDTFILSEDIDIDKIKAEMEAGVLKLTLPIKEEVNVQKVITIK